MIIYGWGHVTRRFLGVVASKQCPQCGQTSGWQLCIMRTWFTLFFIPIIPYRTVYCMMCPNCHAYVEMDRERFDEVKAALSQGQDEAYKYAGKTPTQIAYLKAQEEARKNQEEQQQ